MPNTQHCVYCITFIIFCLLPTKKLTFQRTEKMFNVYVSKLINTAPFIKKKDPNFKGKITSNRTLEIFESLFRYKIMLRMGCKTNRNNMCVLVSINFFRVMENISYPQQALSICMSISGSRKFLFVSSHGSNCTQGFDPLLLGRGQIGHYHF